MKTCKKCGLRKPLAEFYTRVGRRGQLGKRGECRECTRKRARQWQQRVAASTQGPRVAGRWSCEEEEWLIAHYRRGYSTVDCAILLGRSYRAVKARVDILAITGPSDWRLESGIELEAA